jgi:hypothetical protein
MGPTNYAVTWRSAMRYAPTTACEIGTLRSSEDSLKQTGATEAATLKLNQPSSRPFPTGQQMTDRHVAQIRVATPDDAPALAVMHVASWRETYAGILPDRILSAREWHSFTHSE